MATGAWAVTSPTAMNCDAPAKTRTDMAMDVIVDNPAAEATAP